MFDRATRSLLSGSDEEVTEASSFYLGGAPKYGQHVRRDVGLDALRSGGLGFHGNLSLPDTSGI